MYAWSQMPEFSASLMLTLCTHRGMWIEDDYVVAKPVIPSV